MKRKNLLIKKKNRRKKKKVNKRKVLSYLFILFYIFSFNNIFSLEFNNRIKIGKNVIIRGQTFPILIRKNKKIIPRIFVNDRKYSVKNFNEEWYVVFVNYDLLSSEETACIKIKENNTTIYKNDFTIIDPEFEYERIYLPRRYNKDQKKYFNQLYPSLSYYEENKINTTIRNYYYSRYFQGKFSYPLKGRITSPFGKVRAYNNGGYNSYHTGIDIGGNKIGTPIYAPNNGIVILSEIFYKRGKTLIIAHGINVKSLYYHLDNFNVSKGDIVNKGDIIGYVGTTGFSTGPHLHWEVRIDNNIVNPNFFVKNDIEEF